MGAFIYRKKLFDLVCLAKQHPPYLALSAFAILISVAIILDANVIRFRGLEFAEELLELNAALSLVVVCLCIYEPNLNQLSGATVRKL